MLIVLVLVNRIIASTAISAATEMLCQVLPVMEMHVFLAGSIIATIASLLSRASLNDGVSGAGDLPG